MVIASFLSSRSNMSKSWTRPARRIHRPETDEFSPAGRSIS